MDKPKDISSLPLIRTCFGSLCSRAPIYLKNVLSKTKILNINKKNNITFILSILIFFKFKNLTS